MNARRAPQLLGRLILATLLLAAVGSLGCSEPTRPTAATATVSSTPTVAATPATLSDTQVEALLRRAVCWYADPGLARTCLPVEPEARGAIEAMAASGDRRFIAPLVDMANVAVGWNPQVEAALQRLTNDRAEGPRGWREWLTAHPPVVTPSGYGEWKARLLALTQTAETKPTYLDLLGGQQRGGTRLGGSGLGAALPLLHWTQVQPNASKPLTTPRSVTGRTATWLEADEVVYGLAVGGVARAYPRRIVAWHGAVNDVLGGQPVLLAYCVPCSSGVAFDRRLEADTLEFGTSGLVLQSRALLLDQSGNRLWDALTGAAIGEPRATLATVPMFTTTWADWFARHPETTVIDLATTGALRNYAPAAAIKDALAAPGPLYPVTPVDTRLGAKEPVLGVLAGDQQRAYPLVEAGKRRLLRDRIGTQDIVIVTEGEGRAIAAYDATGVEFVRIIDSGVDLVVADSEGNRWAMRESALIDEKTRKTMRALPMRQSYWFAWSGAYPSTSVYAPQ